MGKYIFKTVKTRGGAYLYDRNTNTVFAIREEEFEDLQKVEQNSLYDYRDIVQRRRKYGQIE